MAAKWNIVCQWTTKQEQKEPNHGPIAINCYWIFCVCESGFHWAVLVDPCQCTSVYGCMCVRIWVHILMEIVDDEHEYDVNRR